MNICILVSLIGTMFPTYHCKYEKKTEEYNWEEGRRKTTTRRLRHHQGEEIQVILVQWWRCNLHTLAWRLAVAHVSAVARATPRRGGAGPRGWPRRDLGLVLAAARHNAAPVSTVQFGGQTTNRFRRGDRNLLRPVWPGRSQHRLDGNVAPIGAPLDALPTVRPLVNTPHPPGPRYFPLPSRRLARRTVSPLASERKGPNRMGAFRGKKLPKRACVPNRAGGWCRDERTRSAC